MKRLSKGAACKPDGTRRGRILGAAFAILKERGYAKTNTRAIASRAEVSKREIYSEFGNKDGIFSALIAERAARMRAPLERAEAGRGLAVSAMLQQFGVTFLTQLCDPAVLAMFRLAIAAALRSPAMSRVLADSASKPNRQALVLLMRRARNEGMFMGEPKVLAAQFVALLTGDFHVALLLGLQRSPTARELERHSAAAVKAFLHLARPSLATDT